MQVKPEAQSYYQLGAALLRFSFPDPAPLEGVTSRQKSILNMKKARCAVALVWERRDCVPGAAAWPARTSPRPALFLRHLVLCP